MKSLISPRAALAVLGGALAMGAITNPARADEWSKRTILTVNQPIQITDTVLEPGQYVLRLLDSQSDRHVVQIYNGDQTHIINTVLAINTERLQPTGKTRFTFWETPPGTYRAMRTWYYPGDNYGQEFRYPKHLQQIAMVTTPALIPPEPAAAVAETQSETITTESAQEQPAQPQEQEQTEVAQNTAPAQPEPPAQPETPAQSQPMQPTQLPTTGSPYPLIGMFGCLLISLSGLLRLRRRA